MADPFESYADTLTGPAENAATVTPNDSTDLTTVTRALICDAAGTVTVDMLGTGTNIALPVVAGVNPYRVTRVYSTGTTGPSVIVAVW